MHTFLLLEASSRVRIERLDLLSTDAYASGSILGGLQELCWRALTLGTGEVSFKKEIVATTWNSLGYSEGLGQRQGELGVTVR